MKTFQYTITYPIGIHLIPASNLTIQTEQFESRITIRKNGTETNAKTLIGIIALGVRCGETITMTFDGPDEDEAYASTLQYMKENL